MLHNFAFSPYFGFTYHIKTFTSLFLLIFNIGRPKKTGLFMCICVLFISIANKLSEKLFIV